MAEATDEPTPPTYFANAISVLVNADEVSIEFRRLVQSHAEISKATQAGTQPVPKGTAEDFWTIPPVAKVFLTFTAAKFLRDNLITLMPQFEKARKDGA